MTRQMKSAARTARPVAITNASTQRPGQPSETLVPRPEDFPPSGAGRELTLTAEQWVDLDTTAGRAMTWSLTLRRDDHPTAGDTEFGVRVALKAERHCEVGPNDGPAVADITDVIGALSPSEFRRVLAGLNALAASLPASADLPRSVAS